MADKNPLKPGTLLVAHPDLRDTFFYKSVVLLTENHSSGSHGFVLNRLGQMELEDAIASYTDSWPWDDKLYFGGPVSRLSLFLLHTEDFSSSNTFYVVLFIAYLIFGITQQPFKHFCLFA